MSMTSSFWYIGVTDFSSIVIFYSLSSFYNQNLSLAVYLLVLFQPLMQHVADEPADLPHRLQNGKTLDGNLTWEDHVTDDIQQVKFFV